MVFRLFGVFVRHVEADVVQSVNFHLAVNGPGNDVSWSQREALVVFLHKLFAIGQTQDAAIATHGFRNQIGRMRLLRIEEHRWMELYEFHVLDAPFGTIHHGNAVARGNVRVGGGSVDGTCATGCHQCDAAQIGVHLAGIGVQNVRAVAFYVRCAACDANAQVVLRDDFHGKMVLQNLDVWVAAHSLHQSALYFCSGVVSMVQDTEFGVSALAVKVELAVLLFVEVNAPAQQVVNAGRSITHHLFHGCRIAYVVACYHGVFDMLLEVVHQQVCNRGNAALRFCRVGFFQRSLADQNHLAFSGISHLQRITHARNSTSDYQEICFPYHCFFISFA